MNHRPMALFIALTLTIALGVGPAAGQSPAADRSTEAEPSLAEVKAAAERFTDLNVALAEGYLPDPMNLCETAEIMGLAPELGAMGIHYFRPDLLGITEVEPRVDGNGIHTDFLEPAILIYEPQEDGSMALVAVENLVFRAAWRAAGNPEAPTFHGVPWDSMVDDPTTPADEAHGFEPHFDRHVWVFRENPNGVFAPFNPNVTCRHHAPTAAVHPH